MAPKKNTKKLTINKAPNTLFSNSTPPHILCFRRLKASLNLFLEGSSS
jgi:hypothetical protein